MELSHTEYDSVVGQPLFRAVFSPEGGDGGGPRGGVVFVHGLGDHIGRYEEVMEKLAGLGLLCLGFDLPGHGRSGGKRGHVRDLQTPIDVIGESAAFLRSRLADPKLPVGVMAHSTGAFLALQFLVEHPDTLQFAWLNGTLVDPAYNQAWWKPPVAKALARVFPAQTISTQVRASMCVHHPGPPDPLKHRRVSLAYGKALLEAASEFPDRVGQINPELDLLMTHGGDDKVCSPSLAKALFDRVPAERKEWVVIPGAFHETFRDDSKDSLLDEAGRWLQAVLQREGEGAGLGGGGGAQPLRVC